MPSAPISYSGVLSVELFVKAQRLHTRKTLVVSTAVFGVLAFAWLWYSSRSFVLALLLSVLGALGWLAAIAWNLRRQWLKVYKQSPYLSDSVNGTIHADRLEGESAHGRSEWPWKKFVKVRVAPDMLLLYQGPQLFSVLAREHFGSLAEWEAAKSIVTRHVLVV